MTRTLLFIPAFATLALAGCATPASPSESRLELEAYAAECRERGGIIQPIPGAYSGRPRADYACVISGQASRL